MSDRALIFWKIRHVFELSDKYYFVICNKNLVILRKQITNSGVRYIHVSCLYFVKSTMLALGKDTPRFDIFLKIF